MIGSRTIEPWGRGAGSGPSRKGPDTSNEPKWHTDILQIRPAPDSRNRPGGDLPSSWTLGSALRPW